MRNHAKERLRRGESIVAFGLTSASVGVAQVLAGSGVDMLMIDMEHSCVDLASVQALLAADLGPGCTSIVRVPAHLPSIIKPVLDAGAMGLTFPMINDATELAESIALSMYPPKGKRAVGPHTAPARWGITHAQYLREANDALLFNALIETEHALNNIESIVKVVGVNVITIGLGDLAASLGKPGEADHPLVQEAVAHIEAVVRTSSVALGGVAGSREEIADKMSRGYRLIVLGFDVSVLARAATDLVKFCRP
ncbi:2-dehydro-3-deoxyglucarate aldolase [Burkholderia lata]|uniref:2-dehydro-3-deoxyglucarate aldolase n=1 Tax=Burkholderia lata (strain ATCC 17760 / DSM 23089 / LMG 22485 / NCIMB 9086 / R18194 / 383) TaxID=482957 RepID=A0A6P2V2J2_BURL3|nr:aldolase/citrate lyase family protein [Burkholderia lata]VWC77376.1 2-dehydro-3-deoxyglucarate aldolase [Burkholderia lata]